MYKAFELLNTLITSDFPEEKVDFQSTICFCATELLSELQKKTIRNFLNHIPPHNYTDRFTVYLYAVFEDGHTGKYRSLVPLMPSQVSGWTFNLLDEYREATHSNVKVFAIYLHLPSNSQKSCVRMIIHKK